MRLLQLAVLYTALAFGANAALAEMAELEALREGTLKKLIFHSEPKAVTEESFFDIDDGVHKLSEFKGKYVLVNFWATWCAPCRHEMPALDDLQAEFGGDAFQVVTIATGRNPIPAMQKFFEEEEIENLPLFRDPKQTLARNMAVLGLPISVILDPEGREIARMRGDAEWYSDSARAIIGAMIGQTPS